MEDIKIEIIGYMLTSVIYPIGIMYFYDDKLFACYHKGKYYYCDEKPFLFKHKTDIPVWLRSEKIDFDMFEYIDKKDLIKKIYPH